MAAHQSREDILAGFRDQIVKGDIIIGAGAGTGLSAKSIEQGGADLIVVYNSGRYRMAGRGSLAGLMPYGNANDVVLGMADEILPVVRRTPVIAGVCGTDPFRNIPAFLAQLRDKGFSGVQNFPTVGLIDGSFRENLEQTGMSYDAEVDMIRQARLLGLLTAPYVFNEREAQAMARAGADILVVHAGLTAGGTIGARSGLSLDDCVRLVQRVRDAGAEIVEDIIVLCHGGAIATPKDVMHVMANTHGVAGFLGASSIERIPVETAITSVMGDLKNLRAEGAASTGTK